MTAKPDPKKRGNGPISKEKAVVTNAIVGQIADQALEQERDARGRMVGKITDAQLDYALERIAAGDSMRNVTAQLGVCRSMLIERAFREPEFRDRLRLAQESGAYAIVENTLDIARGGDLSSGSIERDKLMCDVAWKWGKTIGNRIFGDKLQVDQRSITINVDSDNASW